MGKRLYFTDEERRAARRAARRRYVETHREQDRAKSRRAYQKYKAKRQEEARLRMQAKRLADPLTAREKRRLRAHRERQELIDAYGGRCACCGETELAFLTLDHVNGDGAKHRREMGDGTYAGASRAQAKIVAQLRAAGWSNEDGRFRILCWNCQWGTRRLEGCPHQRSASTSA